MDSLDQTQTATTVIVGGKYEVYTNRKVGTGGIATVYEGLDLRSRRRVAIKTLRDPYRDDPESRRRFRQEARMMAFASHPALVTVYDLIEQPEGSWIAMELIEGESLRQVIDRQGAVPVQAAVRYLQLLGDGLQHLHDRKIVHLDIKPQNVLVTNDGQLKLIDFGLAQSVAPHQDTIGGTPFGTAAYLAPEQALGEAVDQRTDVYALGCVMFEMVTGRPPFEAPDGPEHKREIISMHIELDPPAPSDVRPDLPFWIDDLAATALEKNPAHRFPSVRAFVQAAIDGLDGGTRREIGLTAALPVDATRAGPVEPFGRTVPSRSEVSHQEQGREQGPSPLRQVWQFGGRAARRTRPLHRTLWRLVLVFALGNFLLATVIIARGGPEALVENVLSVAPGTTVTVAVDELNVRAGPGAVYEVITTLPVDAKVKVTGLSEEDDQGRWWPVEFARNGETMRGWVWAGGLKSNSWTGRLSFMQDIVDGANDSQDAIADLWPF